MQKEHARALLQQMFGPAAEFRDGQWEAIDLAANHRKRVLVVQRTGWGKSVVYFLAAKILRDSGSGPALLISPLLSLMRNQILAAHNLGIRAVTLHSQNVREWKEIEETLKSNEADVLLISPERLASADFHQNLLPLIQGSIAAQVAAMALYCLWVLAMNGAIAPQTLAGLSGTALAPLVTEVGPSVQVLGSLFAILAMGMASVWFSLGLMNMVREWLPSRSRRVLLLPRRQGSLVFEPRRRSADSLRLSITYLGLQEDQPRLRLDSCSIHQQTFTRDGKRGQPRGDVVRQIVRDGLRLAAEFAACRIERLRQQLIFAPKHQEAVGINRIAERVE